LEHQFSPEFIVGDLRDHDTCSCPQESREPSGDLWLYPWMSDLAKHARIEKYDVSQ
jgi:hypothetical protein